MLIFKTHHGQFHKTTTTLVALAAICVIGAAAISVPYWVSLTSMLAPFAVFAATPLGIGILAVVAIALTSLAIYTINRNNKISEMEAPKIIVNDDKEGVLLVTKEVYKEIKANNQNKDKDDKNVEGEYRTDSSSSLESKDYCVTGKIDDVKAASGNTVLLDINLLEEKNDKGDHDSISNKTKQLEGLGLDKEKNEGVNTYSSSLVVEQGGKQKRKK